MAFWQAVLVAGLLLSIVAPWATASAQTGGCAPELGQRLGAQVLGQVLQPDGSGGLAALGEPGGAVAPRSGQVLRLFVRPLDGPAQPAGAGCPVRVATGRLSGMARLTGGGEGFVLDRGTAYGQFRPGEVRVLELTLRPFEDWSSPTEQVEVESLVVTLPETAELVAGLPSPPQPAPGTICADVLFVDAQPAAGVGLQLSIPPDAPARRLETGENGRVCQSGFDEQLFGELALEAAVEPALGQPRSRYVSREANYRLFLVKRPK